MITNILFILAYLIYLYVKKAYSMNAERLTSQPLFTASIIIPIVSFFCLGYIAWSGHSLRLDGEGMNNFLNISKLPIAVLSLAIPFGVIVNNIHRTIQTDKQIKEAESKNFMDRYYAHKKNTIENLQNIDLSELHIINKYSKLEFKNCHSTYKKFYPFASIKNNDFNADSAMIEKANNLFLQLNKLVNKTELNTITDYYYNLNQVEELLHSIHEHYEFKPLDFKEIFSSTIENEENLEFEFRTKFINEDNLKLSISTYLLAHYNIAELFELKITKEFKRDTNELVKYSISVEDRYPRWNTTDLIKGTYPRFKLKLVQ